MPAIPLHTAVSYVAGAYLVFFAIVLLYISIMATKLSRIETDLSELTELAINERERRSSSPPAQSDAPPGEVPKGAAPRSEVPKGAAPQSEVPKGEAPQSEVAKTQAPKSGAVTR